MKGSQLAVAGGVFVAVLIVCFALIGFGAKGEATAKPDGETVVPTPIPAPPPAEPVQPPALGIPKPPAAAMGGFGLIAELERGYDGTIGITRSVRSTGGRTAPDSPAGSGDDPAPTPKKADKGLTDS